MQEHQQEVVALCLALKPLLDVVRGEWRVGDKVFDGAQEHIGYVTATADGCLAVFFPRTDRTVTVRKDATGLIFIPKLSDINRPSRSLMGLVDWRLWALDQQPEWSSKQPINFIARRRALWTRLIRPMEAVFIEPIPELAMLKAIKWQWEQDGKTGA